MWQLLKSLVSSQTNLLGVTLVSLVVSAAVSYFFKKWETRDRLETEYKYEQRKKLRELIGKYHGGVLAAAVSLNYRLFDLHNDQDENWVYLQVGTEYRFADDYFHSSVYRFMNLCYAIRQFEREAVYVDGRIAEKKDFLFVHYLDALRWCVTDAELFEGLPTASYGSTHHFYADVFRQDCDSCMNDEGEFISYASFKERVNTREQPEQALKFFTAIAPGEGGGSEYRWDRLVAFHLVLIGFINAFGYPEQKIPEDQIHLVASQFDHPIVLEKLQHWLPKRGLASDSLTGTITHLMPRFGLTKSANT